MRNLDGYLPLKVCVGQIRRPISILGGGWYGAGDRNNQLYGYHFTKETSNFLHSKVKSWGGGLTVRDLFTFEVLRANGLESIYMTGCPAWYDLPHISETELRSKDPPQKIVISDPANFFYCGICVNLIEYVCEKYPDTIIFFVFHRGIPRKAKIILDALKAHHIEMLDISGDSSVFSVYNDCDLHIGFRVHAHI